MNQIHALISKIRSIDPEMANDSDEMVLECIYHSTMLLKIILQKYPKIAEEEGSAYIAQMNEQAAQEHEPKP